MYFIGQSDPPGGLRTYKLDRIRHVELTAEPFVVSADFDGWALLSRAWGVMYGEGELVHVKLRFSSLVGRRVQETRWHLSERTTPTNDGVIWEADIGDITEIRPWIRGWGSDCEVLEPASLREEMMKEVRQMARRYGIAFGAKSADGPDQSLLDDLFS
jgi:predicted DNA-binding transcriptional regulator YafY